MVKLTVAIPAYNRPDELGECIDSIAQQSNEDVEILICEDSSPSRVEIREVVHGKISQYSSVKIKYIENKKNLGYDNNIKNTLSNSSGEYVMFMGDDDILMPGMVERSLDALQNENVGFVLRGWAAFMGERENVFDEHRYFHGDRLFEPGNDTIAAFFRRCVFISGLIVHREVSMEVETDDLDGLLLYQLYLCGNLLRTKRGYYIDEIFSLRRSDSDHFFGSAEVEKENFAPKDSGDEQSVAFISGIFKVADRIAFGNGQLLSAIREDLGRYSYPMLAVQRENLSGVGFLEYARRLSALGLGKQGLFWIYVWSLLLLGKRGSDACIRLILRINGSTPVLTGVSGKPVSPQLPIGG